MDSNVANRTSISGVQAYASLALLTNELEQTNTNNSLVELMKLLVGIDQEHPLAKLNETTISDNNGGRIVF